MAPVVPIVRKFGWHICHDGTHKKNKKKTSTLGIWLKVSKGIANDCQLVVYQIHCQLFWSFGVIVVQILSTVNNLISPWKRTDYLLFFIFLVPQRHLQTSAFSLGTIFCLFFDLLRTKPATKQLRFNLSWTSFFFAAVVWQISNWCWTWSCFTREKNIPKSPQGWGLTSGKNRGARRAFVNNFFRS